jgi:hypothetical protein
LDWQEGLPEADFLFIADAIAALGADDPLGIGRDRSIAPELLQHAVDEGGARGAYPARAA